MKLAVVTGAAQGIGRRTAEILATAAEEMHLLAPPRRITRPDGAILGFAPELDPTLQPGRQQLADMVLDVVKAA